jgi:hypothetical protein
MPLEKPVLPNSKFFMELQAEKRSIFLHDMKSPVGYSSFIENSVLKTKLDGTRGKVIVLVDLDNFGKEIGEDKGQAKFFFFFRRSTAM